MNKYDVPFNSAIGGDVQSLLFENFTPITQLTVSGQIRKTIEDFEPRVEVLSVSVVSDEDRNANSGGTIITSNLKQFVEGDGDNYVFDCQSSRAVYNQHSFRTKQIKDANQTCPN